MSQPSAGRPNRAIKQSRFKPKPSFQSLNTNDYTKQLANKGKLLRPKGKNHNQHYKQIFTNYSASICCCVLPNTITAPFHQFESTYKIYFKYTQVVLKQKYKHKKKSYRTNDHRTQTIYAYYPLSLSYRQLAAMDKFIKQNNANHQFFAEPYPKPLNETREKRKKYGKQEVYDYETQLMAKPTLSSGPSKVAIFGNKKSMTTQHLNDFAKYLHTILNSPALLLQDAIYEILDIQDQEIITLLRMLAIHKIETWKSEAPKYSAEKCIRDPTKLKNKAGIHFHTLWIVKRPLNNKTASIVGLDHWALKFEGNDQLMTVGFFAYNDDHGIILIKIVPNTPLNRRLFWYFWPRDDVKELGAEHFAERWTVLEKIYLREMTCELVGILIEEWLKYDNHAVYELTHNNCQHFCRDFVAPLDIGIAKRLSASFDVRVAKSLVPAGILAEGIDAEAKCNNIHAKLFPICEKYQKDREFARQQKQLQKKTEEERIAANFDFILNALGMQSSDDNDGQENKNVDNGIIEEEEEDEEMKIDIVHEDDSLIQDSLDSLSIYKQSIKQKKSGIPHDDEIEVDGQILKTNGDLDIDKMALYPSMDSNESKEDRE